MKIKHLFAFACSILIASCEKTQSPNPESNTSQEVYENLIAPNNKILDSNISSTFRSKEEIDRVVEKELKNVRTAAYTEHGPFTTGLSSSREIEGPSGRWNVWRVIFQGIPGYANTTYFGRYYEHSIIVTLPAGAVILPFTIVATNPGYLGSSPPNLITNTTVIGASYSQDNPSIPVYKLTTYTFVPKWLTSGASINPSDISLPSNFTNTTFSYKYFTL